MGNSGGRKGESGDSGVRKRERWGIVEGERERGGR